MIKKDIQYHSLIYFIALLFLLIFFLKASFIHDYFGTSAYDLGIFDQHFWLLSQGLDAFNSVRGMNGFGDHFRPIEIIIGWIYYLDPNIKWAFFLQTLSVALAGLFIYFIAEQQLIDQKPLAFIILLCFYLNPAVHNTLLWQYHGYVLTSGLVSAMLYFYLKNRIIPYGIFLVLILLTREDTGIILLFFALTCLFHKKYRFALLTFALSSIWVIIVFKFVMPYFNNTGYFRHQNGPLSNIFSNLWNIDFFQEKIFDKKNWEYIRLIFLPVLFLPFLAPTYLIPAFAVIGVNILIGGYYPNIDFHYLAMTMPFVFVAMIIGLKNYLLKKHSGSIRIISFFLLAVSLTTYFYYSKLVIGSLHQDYELTLNAKNKRDSLREIHRESLELGIATSDYLLPHLSQRKHIYLFPNPWVQHYWGINGEHSHHPNQVDLIILPKLDYYQHYQLIYYLTTQGYFKKTQLDSGLYLLKRLKKEADDKQSAKKNVYKFYKNETGIKFSDIRFSQVIVFDEVTSNNLPIDFCNKFTQKSNLSSSFININFSKEYNRSPIGSAYVCTNINVNKKTKLMMRVRSDDGVTIWINNKVIWENHIYRSIHAKPDDLNVILNSGNNSFIFRVDNIGGNWQLIAEIIPLK